MVVWSFAARNLPRRTAAALACWWRDARKFKLGSFARRGLHHGQLQWKVSLTLQRKPLIFLIAVGAFAIANAHPSQSQTVKVTPLGSHDNKFCALDRTIILEDADGTRILYDAGRTVRGPDDARLGNINAVLLSHVHGDHLGDVIQPSANAGECGKPDFSVKVTPKSNTVDIVVAKKAQLLVGSEMASFIAKKIGAAGGQPLQSMVVRFGASRKVGGVT
jgi:hypothetical protein